MDTMSAYLLLYLLVHSLTPSPAVAQEDAPVPLFVRAERLILSPGEELVGGALLIEDGVITAVGTELQAPAGARELTGGVVCAGFLDAWSSLGLDPLSAQDLATDPAVRTAYAIDPWHDPQLRDEALRGGVTAARVQAGMRAPVGGVGAVLRTSTGSELVLADACLGASIGVSRAGGPPDVFDRVGEVDRLVGSIKKGLRYREDQVEHRHELDEWKAAIAEKEAELEKDFKKAKKSRDKKVADAEEDGKEHKEKRYREDKRPRPPKYHPASEVLARVAHGEMPLVVEIHRSAELRRLLDRTKGYDRLRLVIAGATESLDHAETLAARGIPVIVWPAPLGERVADEYDEHDLGLAGELERRGVSVILGSGGGPHARELRLLAALAVSHGLSREAALEAITSMPARTFDVADRIGTLAPGMEADLLVFDGDPLETTTRLLHCVSKGEVVSR